MTVNFKNGGVMRSRLRASAKNKNMSSIGCGSQIFDSKVCTFIRPDLLPDFKQRCDPLALHELELVGEKMIQIRRSLRV